MDQGAGSPTSEALPAERRRWLGRRRRGHTMTEEQFERRFAAQFTQQFSQHWTQLRAERRQDERSGPPADSIGSGPSNFQRAQVPYGVDLAAAWSWRFLVIVAAGFLIARAIGFLSLVVMPVVIALLLTALLTPLVTGMAKTISRGVATLLVVLGLVGGVALMLTFATQQVVQGANGLSGQVVDGLDRIRDWLKDGPLNISDAQIEDAIQQAQDAVTSSNAEIVRRLTEVSTTIGHIVAAFFIVLFSTFFFLADGQRIWSWVVRLFPRAARARADASGRVAWVSLTAFVRATVLVALVDAVGIALVALILGLPFVAAIGVLVFLGAFIPLVGAAITGLVAILVALVANGPISALIMLGGVVVVQLLEAHVLQPFLLGRMVQVHPLAVILAVASGAFLAGIPGALVAVPLAASMNAVVVYLASASSAAESSGAEGAGADPPRAGASPAASNGTVNGAVPHTGKPMLPSTDGASGSASNPSPVLTDDEADSVQSDEEQAAVTRDDGGDPAVIGGRPTRTG